MAQIQADFPDLAQMFGAQSVMPAILGMQRFNQAQQAQGENIQGAQQSRQLEAQKAPLDLERIAAATAQDRAQTGLMGQQAEGLRLKNEELAGVPLKMRQEAAIADYAAKTSAKEIADHEAAIRKGLIHENPEVRKQAEFMWNQLDKVKMKKMELEEQAKSKAYDADTRARASKEVAMLNAGSRENVAIIKANAAAKGKDIMGMMMSGKLKPEVAISTFAALAAVEQDPEVKQMYTALSQQAEIQAQKLRPAPQPQVDPSKVPGAPLTTPALPGVTPMPGTQAPAAPGNGDIQKAITGAGWTWEPNKYDYRIGPDGRPQRKLKGQ
jgi:hypothetical protein